MRVAVVCPMCEHVNLRTFDTLGSKLTMCDDPEDGGCGERFVFRVSEIRCETWTLLPAPIKDVQP